VPGYNQGAAWGVQAKHVDLDVFNGTSEELSVWAGVEHTDDAEIPLPAESHIQRLDEINRMQTFLEERKRELA
jgi:hypothetical protein